MAVKVSKENFESEVLNRKETVIVDFYSDSCVPCKRISPLLAEIEEENKENVILAKLNINFDMETAEQYDVSSVPTLVFFKNGREVGRLVGTVNKDKIIDTLKLTE